MTSRAVIDFSFEMTNRLNMLSYYIVFVDLKLKIIIFSQNIHGMVVSSYKYCFNYILDFYLITVRFRIGPSLS